MDVYDHDIDLEKLDDIDHGVKARVVIDGWDKLIQRPDRVELYDLKTDNNDETDLSAKNKDTVARLEALIADYLK